MDAFPTRSASQRKRSHSTTAYSTSLLAAAAGSQVLTYEFINTQAIQPPANAVPGQYEANQTSNERTAFDIASLKWSPDNKMLAVEAVDGRICLHDNRGQYQEALVDEPAMETSRSETKRSVLSWTPKAQRLYFANGNKVMNWDPTSQRIAETLEMPSRINALAINNGDTLLAIGQNNGNVDVVNRVTGVMTRLDTPTSKVVSKLEYSIFSRSMLGSIGYDHILRLWDTGSSGSTTVYHSFTTTHEAPISDMAFSPLNPYLICTAGLDKQYALYDVEKKTVAMTTRTDYGLTSVAFKNENNLIAFGTVNGKILLYDLRSHTRPIIIVDTRVDSPVSAVHFQGKQSLPSMKRHQTVSEFTLKGQQQQQQQSPTGSQSAFSIKGSATSSKTLPPMASEDVTRSTTEFIPTRPPLIKTTLASHSVLNHSTSSSSTGGASHPTREVHSAGVATKSLVDMFSAKPNTGLSVLTGMGSKQSKAPSPILTSNFTQIGTASITASGRSTPGGGGGGAAGAGAGGNISSVPTTPAKEITGQLGSSGYSNSRTTSPYTFRGLHRHRSSVDYDDGDDEDSPMSSSSAHSPPISPGAGVPSNKNSHQRHHDHQSTSTSKSPSRGLIAKHQTSLGAQLASGRPPSALSIPDILSDENMEMLGGQIVNQVQNALLDQEHVMRSSSRAATNSLHKTARKATTTSAVAGLRPVVTEEGVTAAAITESESKAKAFRDLWLQVGLENGESSKRPSSPLSNATRSSFLAQPAALGSGGMGVMMDSSQSAPSGMLQTKILESVVEDCLMNFRAGIRNDIQNMHLELLRQFQIQKMEIEGLLKRYTDTKELREEVEKLKEENQRLRMNY